MRVGLLGPLLVVDGDGAELLVTAPKERVVLSWLALRAGATVRAAELMSVLWDDDPPVSAAKTLQNYVSALRRVLPVGAIDTVPGGYRLAVGPDDIDVGRFERFAREGVVALGAGDAVLAADRLTAALRLWRGEPLTEVADRPAGTAEATRLAESRRGVEEQLFDARLGLGEHAVLVADLDAAVAAEPLREKRWGQLMLALYRCGRQADALRAYQRLRTVLADELGLDPGEEIRNLEAAILAQDSLLNVGPMAWESAAIGKEDRSVGLPAGTVTFLFTDIEGSTRLWQQDEAAMRTALSRHDDLVRRVITEHSGTVFSTMGDGLAAAFATASAAITAAVATQRALRAEAWPTLTALRVRMGVHTGEAAIRDGDYFGTAVNRAARLTAVGHGGQILVSSQTAGLSASVLPPDVSLVERGLFVLRDFDQPERIFQVVHADLDSVFPPLRASPAMSHSLPDVRTSFVGRDSDLRGMEGLLASRRLVTVVGVGGSGKTRLAVELAARMAAHFETGAVLADLSPLDDPGLVPATIAAAFGLRDHLEGSPSAAVGQHLSGRTALLVVDNCEHVIDAAAVAIDALLSTARGLCVVATSREPLHVAGEQLWRITQLGLPETTAPVEAAMHSDSVRLFADRARLGDAGFELDAGNVSAVVSICRHLEGLPLAIELAAARAATMTVAAIAAQLENPSQSSQPQAPRATARHRSLEATIEWSYRLLDDEQRRLLRGLSVFAGGFTPDAVEAVHDGEDALNTLFALVDKSLTVRDRDTDRYRLLETVRAFARRRLDEQGEAQLVADRHLGWCADFTASADNVMRTSKEAQIFAMIDGEIDNIRAALAWAETNAHPSGLAVIANITRYWAFRAPVEGRRWADRLLRAVTDAGPIPTGMVHSVRAMCAFHANDFQPAVADAEHAVILLRQVDSPKHYLDVLTCRATVTSGIVGGEALTIARYLEAYTVASQIGHTVAQAAILNNLAAIELQGGDPATGRAYAEQGISLLETTDGPLSIQAILRMNLGFCRLQLGESGDTVKFLFVDALERSAQTRSPMIVAWNLDGLAETIAPSRPHDAAQLLGAANHIRLANGLARYGEDRDEPSGGRAVSAVAHFRRTRRKLDIALGADQTDELMRSIGQVTLEQAIELARHHQ